MNSLRIQLKPNEEQEEAKRKTAVRNFWMLVSNFASTKEKMNEARVMFSCQVDTTSWTSTKRCGPEQTLRK